jgi:integrase
MKNRFSIFKNRSRGGIYYLKDQQTEARVSLNTKDQGRANELLSAYREAAREPAFNLQKARIYLAASDAGVATRTWRKALETLASAKPEGSANRKRWETFAKDKAIQSLLDLVILETRTEQLLNAVTSGTVSTNVYLRRLQNFCVGMNWLPWPILPKKLWPPVKYKNKRAIKHEEHLKIVAREGNEERRKFYELLWELGGAQSDIAWLDGEDVDWSDWTICYNRRKLAALNEMDVKPPLLKFGKRCAAILRSLPQSGPLFPYLRTVDCKDRATEFRQRCKGLGIEGVTLHSYRYAWAERARKAHYPRRQAEEALGHNSKAVHIAYAKRAQVTVDSLEEYEEAAAKKVVRVEFDRPDSVLPAARP